MLKISIENYSACTENFNIIVSKIIFYELYFISKNKTLKI